MTPAQISALRAVSDRCRAAGSRVWLEPAAVLALLDALTVSQTNEEALLKQARRSVCALAHAAENYSEYAPHYEELSDAIAAMKGTP